MPSSAKTSPDVGQVLLAARERRLEPVAQAALVEVDAGEHRVVELDREVERSRTRTAATAWASVSALAGASPTGSAPTSSIEAGSVAVSVKPSPRGQQLDLAHLDGVERAAVGLGDARVGEGAARVAEERVDRPRRTRRGPGRGAPRRRPRGPPARRASACAIRTGAGRRFGAGVGIRDGAATRRGPPPARAGHDRGAARRRRASSGRPDLPANRPLPAAGSGRRRIACHRPGPLAFLARRGCVQFARPVGLSAILGVSAVPWPTFLHTVARRTRMTFRRTWGLALAAALVGVRSAAGLQPPQAGRGEPDRPLDQGEPDEGSRSGARSRSPTPGPSSRGRRSSTRTTGPSSTSSTTTT